LEAIAVNQTEYGAYEANAHLTDGERESIADLLDLWYDIEAQDIELNADLRFHNERTMRLCDHNPY
jgi:hypothetical protein